MDGHLLYFDLSLDLAIIALLNAFVRKGAWLPLIILVFKGECLSITDLKTSVNGTNFGSMLEKVLGCLFCCWL